MKNTTCEDYAESDSFKKIKLIHLIMSSCFMVFSFLSQSVAWSVSLHTEAESQIKGLEVLSYAKALH